MKNDLTELETKALRLAKEFTNIVLGDDISPKGKCFTVCYPLSIYLKIRKIDVTVAQGQYFSIKKNKKIAREFY